MPEGEPSDDDLLTIYSASDGDSSYDGWRALWRAGYEAGIANYRKQLAVEREAFAREFRLARRTPEIHR